ncbi:MAG TPA: ArsB/NhaD family transporter [Thermotogota bacterium]|nr:ArsB/NhaD family transporter [Thermotogota bacterium]HRW92991.1 ArsB/NhaD family transporter [Thermotogota bacterium]
MSAIIALVVFCVVYYFIISEKINRTIIVILGAFLLFFLGIFAHVEDAATRFIDFKTIFLLVGMMLLVSSIKKTRFFEWVALGLLRASKGKVLRVFIYLNVAVALFSGFLDNVTTLLIFIPITFAIVDIVKASAAFFVVSEIISSNIGGTATLIGDPPNILIGSAANLPFIGFLQNTAPPAIVILLITLLVMALINRKEMQKTFDPHTFDRSDPVPKSLLVKSSILLGITVFLFVFEHRLGIQNWITALGMGFFSVLVLDSHGLERHLKEVEWETIFFFVGLFLITGALEETGVLQTVAHFLESRFGGSLSLFQPALFGFSFVMSGLVDNIPFTATMIPVIKHLPDLNPTMFTNLNPLWWSLSLGVCLGGNLTAIGASANVIGISLMRKHYHIKMGFVEFLKHSWIASLISLVVGVGYILIRYS